MRSLSWQETQANPLSLLAGYKRNPAAFSRPGPPPEPPLPLRFTCSTCRRDVKPDASTCGNCGAQLWFVGGHG